MNWPRRTDDRSNRRQAATGIAYFGAILLLVGADLLFDYKEGTNLFHLVVETLIFFLTIIGLWVGWLQYRAARVESRALKHDLQLAVEEASRWREESRALIDGLGEAIDLQFRRWKLTPAEAEVGVLLLKGLSHRDVAGVRSTSERTVREQARSLYRKASLAGRSELSAFFLEDLLVPETGPGNRAVE
jgi:DNA-binding CsgD family transcriptional regulator